MAKIGKIKDSDMLISGELEERLPAVTRNLVAYFPFDGTYSKVRNFNGIKVLYQKPTEMADPEGMLAKWLKTQGAVITPSDDLTLVTIDTAKQYDLVLADFYAWATPVTIIDKLKEFVDAGVSCIAQGNDTRQNYFVKSYNVSAVRATHDILIDENAPLENIGRIVPGSGSSDLFGGIIELQNNALPLYRRMDEGFIVGWYYQSQTSGAVLYFDQEGHGNVYDYVKASIDFALRNSKGGVTTGDVVLADDGLYAQNSTTNLWAGNLGIYNNYSQPASLTATGETFMGQPVYRLAMTVTDETRLTHFQTSLSGHGVTGSSRTYLANTKYAASIYYKLVNKLDTVVGGVASNISGWYAGDTEEIGGGWKRYTQYRNGTVATNGTDSVFFSFNTPSLQLNETVYIDFACPMIEEGKDYATAYNVGTRGNNAKVEINNLNLQDFSLAFKFKPTIEHYKTSTGAYNRQMLALIDTTNAREIRYVDYLATPSTTATSSSPYFDLEPSASFGASANYHYHGNYGYVKNKWHNVIITRSGAQLRIYVELDGTVLRDQTFTTVLDSTFKVDKLRLGYTGDTVWNGSFRDLAIYDKTLTDGEIKKLTVSRLNITTSGNIITGGVVERPHIPSGAKYFPLGANGNSEFEYIKPVTETDTAYRDGAVWLGSAYTNLFTQSDNGTFTVTNGKAFEVLTNGANEVIYKHQFSGESYNYKGRDIAVTANTAYTVSVEIFISEDYNGSAFDMFRLEQAIGSAFTYDSSKKGTWQRFTRTYTPTADGNLRVLMYPNNPTHTTPGSKGYILFKNPQVVANTVDYPFVNGTRPYQRLTYKTSDLTLNDWQEFSLSITVKYSTNGVYRLSGAWSKFYFGLNTGDKLQFSWIEDSIQKNFSAGNVIPKDKWVTIGVSVKNNTFIDLYVNGELIGSQTTTFNLNATAKDFALNSIEPTSSSYPLNAWVKDFIVIPKALTEEEMAIVAKKHMSSNKNQIQVRGQFIEGQTLV